MVYVTELTLSSPLKKDKSGWRYYKESLNEEITSQRGIFFYEFWEDFDSIIECYCGMGDYVVKNYGKKKA